MQLPLLCCSSLLRLHLRRALLLGSGALGLHLRCTLLGRSSTLGLLRLRGALLLDCTLGLHLCRSPLLGCTLSLHLRCAFLRCALRLLRLRSTFLFCCALRLKLRVALLFGCMLRLRPRGLIGRRSLLRRDAIGLRLHLSRAFGCATLLLCRLNLCRAILGGTGLQRVRLRGTLLLRLRCLLLRRTLLDQACLLIRCKAADRWSIPRGRCGRMYEAVAARPHRWRRQRPAGIAAGGR